MTSRCENLFTPLSVGSVEEAVLEGLRIGTQI